MSGAEHLEHPIAPVYDGRSRVLLLGSFPSPASRETGFFYGHPRNRMWRVLAAVTGEGTVPSTVEERRAFLLRERIAMYDVAASCTIEGAADASIRDVVPTDLAPIFSAAPALAVFTTGGTASRLYRACQLPVTGVEDVRLPSTSAANASWSLEALVEAYARALAPCLRT